MLRLTLVTFATLSALAITACAGTIECVATYSDSAGNELGTASFEYEDIDVDQASDACTEDAAAEAPTGTVGTACSCNQ